MVFAIDIDNMRPIIEGLLQFPDRPFNMVPCQAVFPYIVFCNKNYVTIGQLFIRVLLCQMILLC